MKEIKLFQNGYDKSGGAENLVKTIEQYESRIIELEEKLKVAIEAAEYAIYKLDICEEEIGYDYFTHPREILSKIQSSEVKNGN